MEALPTIGFGFYTGAKKTQTFQNCTRSRSSRYWYCSCSREERKSRPPFSQLIPSTGEQHMTNACCVATQGHLIIYRFGRLRMMKTTIPCCRSSYVLGLSDNILVVKRAPKPKTNQVCVTLRHFLCWPRVYSVCRIFDKNTGSRGRSLHIQINIV